MPQTLAAARAKLRIYTGHSMIVNGSLDMHFIETEVAILAEKPGCYVVDYPADFKVAHPRRQLSEIVPKDDHIHTVTYLAFTEVMADEAPGDLFKMARFAVDTMTEVDGGWSLNKICTEVQVVEETETHYRLRFSQAFALEHPNYCSQWVSKNSRFTKITFVD